MALAPEDITSILSQPGMPRVGVYASDGNRRALRLFEEFDFENIQSYSLMVNKISNPNHLEVFFAHGLHTLFVPVFPHGNLQRLNRSDSIQYYVRPTLSSILEDPKWLDFYNKWGIRVSFYGDIGLVEAMGFVGLAEKISALKKATNFNQRHVLFFGVACSNYYEIPRLVGLALDLYQAQGRRPSREELVRMYYGDQVEDVDFFLRSVALRDSDVQPPLISGRKAQFYFLVAPSLFSLTPKVFKSILYDLIYCRDITTSRRLHTNEDLTIDELKKLKAFYQANSERVIGLGERIGTFWIPT